MPEDRYYIKIVPHKGDAIHRFVVRRRHVALVSALACACLLAALGYAALQYRHLGDERAALAHIAGQTAALHRQLQRVQQEDREIARLIGAPTPAPRHAKAKVSWARPSGSVRSLESRVRILALASATLLSESERNHRLVLRVLNLRHIHALAQERLMAFIPSIDPVAGAAVTGCFCYRTSPDVEFHEGVDLSADYGEPVRASAAGTIASAAWDGGYGLKIDIDHGNGYHTWYAHLSRIDVHVGQRVYKGQTIAAVGATGFATGPHLHYQVMLDGRPVDPAPYLDGIPSSVIAALR
ncbi:MAG TPA: M23 family metallopeptidase [Candidatus Dormibacteraeota bacterium]|nr:M23 family metallopeptidase [Candidatus Dormibacteraeota bacterium]